MPIIAARDLIVLTRALKAYVESLEARRYPVPYAIRDELRIRRLACAPHRGL